MESLILPVALTTAAAAAVVNLWLAVRIGRVRIAERVSIGDGGNPRLQARMRAQLNFAEYTPIVLILIALVELAGGGGTTLWGVAALYIVGRVAHGFGMDRPTPNPLRAGGTIVTMLVTLGLAGWAAWIVAAA
ncbi:MAPEG family protein [Sphingosinithalassobacter sp. CS137]|uniref:MAPEG family protein n=1 Tax=Sphingosinithalassobacter sp. CS137 TaxID=2762748 RepID=UPI00165D457C|nr:MAPEG family protein [Sphingosinithalassobacter sp. CS137]